ncbi:hypothetical protein Plhal304r1_c051g0134431 [Plasmopara halstedii]
MIYHQSGLKKNYGKRHHEDQKRGLFRRQLTLVHAPPNSVFVCYQNSCPPVRIVKQTRFSKGCEVTDHIKRTYMNGDLYRRTF